MKVTIVAMVLVFALGVVMMFMLSGLDEVPRWWREREAIQPGDSAIIERAERVENAITTQLTAVRDPSDPRWFSKVSDEQANAWLSVRLRDTIETHLGADAWGDGIERVYVRVEGEDLMIGVRVRHQAGSAIVSAKIDLELDETGFLWANMHSLRIGRTPVPDWAVRFLGQGDLRTGRVRLGPGKLDLGDGREARLIAIRVRDSWIEVVVETRAESK